MRLLIVFILLICSSNVGFSSESPTHSAQDLLSWIEQLKSDLKHENKKKLRFEKLYQFQSYLAEELAKQREIKDPSPEDDIFSLTLIGLNDSLASFMDEPSHDFSSEKCLGYRASLIRSYIGTVDGDRDTDDLPFYAQDSL